MDLIENFKNDNYIKLNELLESGSYDFEQVFNLIVEHESFRCLEDLMKWSNEICIIKSTKGLSERFVKHYIDLTFQLVPLYTPQNSKMFIQGVDGDHMKMVIDKFCQIELDFKFYNNVEEKIRVLGSYVYNLAINIFRTSNKESLVYFKKLNQKKLYQYFQMLIRFGDLESCKNVLMNQVLENYFIKELFVSEACKDGIVFLLENNLVQNVDEWIELIIESRFEKVSPNFFDDAFSKHFEILTSQDRKRWFPKQKVTDRWTPYTQVDLFLALKRNMDFAIMLFDKGYFKFKKEHVTFFAQSSSKDWKKLLGQLDHKLESAVLIDCINSRNFEMFFYLVNMDMVVDPYSYHVLSALDSAYFSDNEFYERHIQDNEEEWDRYLIWINPDHFDICNLVDASRQRYYNTLDQELSTRLIKDLINLIKEFI